MLKHKTMITLLIASLALAPLAGCDSLPGDKKTQGAVIGGVGGAVAGGALAKNNRLLGALIGGALGAGGGYLIGSQLDKSDPKHRDDAIAADKRARDNPASPDDARSARTADINNDGYVTMDEVVAMHKAGLSADDMITRLERTGQFFELTTEQERYLKDQGVPARVVTAMRDINKDVRDKAYDRYGNKVSDNNRTDRISNDRDTSR
ncbi:MAG TPA: glycine zipper domain-containing protein [Tepidisphaeraceae bacterium]|jgi:hypothetical protein|nr:glycine zipper domain-containing protein [Tepidisphaeraceae bacterium]